MHASDALTIAAQAGFVGVGAWLTHIDIREHRLPNRVLLPATIVAILLCALASAAEGSAGILVRALAGGLILGAVYLVLRAASRGGLGGGDVKLAVPVGIVLAWDGWAAFAAGGALAFAVGGVWALGMIVMRRGTMATHMAFGPCMILGAVCGLALT
ncbi:prepilin peptidase [Microbacterium karelineae]|uniref:prepilin peptidase n=1 Tax=Microbacterium karelineae TaxID=2654283 RepID=UPI0012E9BB81|nr:A24 family peptidase [Microbacterium karelineae]